VKNTRKAPELVTTGEVDVDVGVGDADAADGVT
jgi:hypothetical protein